jgi:cell division inhibitor SepF
MWGGNATVNAQPLSDDEYPRRSFWAKCKDMIVGVEEPDEDETHAGVSTPASQKQAQPLRLQTARGGRVAVRLNAQVFEDAKVAADGLKGGEQQIVNLEKATPQMGERIIDFLNGVCYALDGTVERVGERVYMFVPANVVVDVDQGATAASSARRTNYGD